MLSQRFKERDLLKVDSKTSESGEGEAERESEEGCVPATCPGLTWDSVTYTDIFKFNQDLEKTEVSSNALSLAWPGLAC